MGDLSTKEICYIGRPVGSSIKSEPRMSMTSHTLRCLLERTFPYQESKKPQTIAGAANRVISENWMLDPESRAPQSVAPQRFVGCC